MATATENKIQKSLSDLFTGINGEKWVSCDKKLVERIKLRKAVTQMCLGVAIDCRIRVYPRPASEDLLQFSWIELGYTFAFPVANHVFPFHTLATNIKSRWSAMA